MGCTRRIAAVAAVVAVALLLLQGAAHAAPAATAVAAPRPQEVPKSAFGQAFAEVVVESSLRVVGKGNNRAGRQGKKLELPPPTTASATSTSTSERAQRVRRQRNHFYQPRPRDVNRGANSSPPHRNSGPRIPPSGLPSSANAAQSSAQGFNVQGPQGSWGASATHNSNQGWVAGPMGAAGSAGASGSQQYRLPDGSVIDVAFSQGFSFGGPGGASAAESSSVTITRPDGSKQVVRG